MVPNIIAGVPTIVKTNIMIRSMGPVSELEMVIQISLLKQVLRDVLLMKFKTFKDYSMDCYFRQYWRDSRLSFKSPIKSLSLSIKVKRFFKSFEVDSEVLEHVILIPSIFFSLNSRCWRECGNQVEMHKIRVKNDQANVLFVTSFQTLIFTMQKNLMYIQ